MTKKQKAELSKKQIAFVMGCDLQSDPSSAAFEQLMSTDVLKPGNPLHIPDVLDKDQALKQYQLIQNRFDDLKLTDKKLRPLQD